MSLKYEDPDVTPRPAAKGPLNRKRESVLSLSSMHDSQHGTNSKTQDGGQGHATRLAQAQEQLIYGQQSIHD